MIRNTGLLAAAIVCFLMSLLLEHFSFYNLAEDRIVRRFQETLQDKEHHTYALFDEMEQVMAQVNKDSMADLDQYFTLLHSQMNEGTSGKGLDLFIVKDDTLRFWTGNKVSVETLLVNENERDGLVFAGNSWLLKRERKVGDCRLISLILIKHEYQYENRFLRNDFQADFNVPMGTLIMHGGDHAGDGGRSDVRARPSRARDPLDMARGAHYPVPCHTVVISSVHILRPFDHFLGVGFSHLLPADNCRAVRRQCP